MEGFIEAIAEEEEGGDLRGRGGGGEGRKAGESMAEVFEGRRGRREGRSS